MAPRIRGQAERLPLGELRVLAGECPTSVGIPLKRSYMGPVLFSMQTAACARHSKNVNEIFLLLTCRIDINIAMHFLRHYYCYVIVTSAAYPIDAPEGERKAKPPIGESATYPYV